MKTLAITAFTLFLGLTLFAQDAKVTTGVTYYNQGAYKKALNTLNEALENPNEIKDKYKAKAYYYRGESYLKLMSQTAYDQKHDELLEMAQYPFYAKDDFKKAIELEGNEDYGKKAQVSLLTLRNVMLQGGLTALNTLYTVDDEETRKGFINEADAYLNAALDIEEDYLVHDLLGQLENEQKNREAAYEHFQTSLKLFEQSPPPNPDIYIAYVSYRKAIYEAYYKEVDESMGDVFGDVDAALASLKHGLNLLDTEYLRYDATGQTQATAKYEQVKTELTNFKLDLYLQGGGEGSEGVEAMKKAVAENPKDYTLIVAYAQMLESTDIEKAIEHYQLATEVEPDKTMAWFNLGAVYNNIATDIIQEANEDGSLEEMDAAMEEATPYLEWAFECFEQCYRINPNDIGAVDALKMISINLNDMEAYEKYLGIQKQLKGQ